MEILHGNQWLLCAKEGPMLLGMGNSRLKMPTHRGFSLLLSKRLTHHCDFRNSWKLHEMTVTYDIS